MREQVEHFLESCAVEWHLDWFVFHTRLAVHDDDFLAADEYRMTKGGSSLMSACKFRGHLDACNGVRLKSDVEDPEEVLVVVGLGEVVIRAGRHGDQVSPKIMATVDVLGLGEKARRRNMLTRRGRTRHAKQVSVISSGFFWLTIEYTDRHITRIQPANSSVIVVSVLTRIIHELFCCNRRSLTQARRARLAGKTGRARQGSVRGFRNFEPGTLNFMSRLSRSSRLSRASNNSLAACLFPFRWSPRSARPPSHSRTNLPARG